MNTLDFLNIATAICPERECVVFEGKRFTFAEVSRRADRLAGALAGLGVRKGERVAMLQVNCHQYLEAYYAVAKVGAIFVPLNFRAKAIELSHVLNNVAPSVLLVGERYLDLVSGIRQEVPCRRYVSIDRACSGMLYYETLIEGCHPCGSCPVEDRDQTLLMATAGTSAHPKVVPLTHDNLSYYVLSNVEPASPDLAEKNLLAVPLCHIAGFQAMLAAVYGGRTLLMLRQFEVREWLETAQRERATRAMLVPTMLKQIVDQPDFASFDLSHLRVVTYGGARMPLEVISKARRAMPWVRFINAYGQTETAATISALDLGEQPAEGQGDEKALKRLTSIGKPMPGIEMKVVDDDAGELPAGEVGEILVRGPQVSKGYWGDLADSDRMVSANGWHPTGDTGYRDEDGYFYVTGRKDQLIIRGGENICPEEVEEMLYQYSKVKEVVVIGVPDPEWGEQPRAVVVLEEGQEASEEEVIEFCRETLSSFKIPRSVVFVAELPRSPAGKVLRRKVKELYGQA